MLARADFTRKRPSLSSSPSRTRVTSFSKGMVFFLGTGTQQRKQQAIEKNEFQVTAALRLVIVLPLEIEDGRVIPIPMIIDTGALPFMYLGTGCRWALAELSCLQRGVMLKNISLQLNHSESGSTAACLRSSSCYRNRDLSNILNCCNLFKRYKIAI